MSRLRNRNKLCDIVLVVRNSHGPVPGRLRARGTYDRGIVMDLPAAPRRWNAADLLLYLVGVYGVAFALTGVWLGMRSVMDIGGSCASGGPYQIATPCPEGVDVLLTLGIPLGIVSAGLMVWKGSRIGPMYAGLVALAWPVLFLSLGWNFLEYGVRNPFGEGVELGWLIPGVIFVIMGGVPLLGWLAARGHGPVVPGVRSTTTPIELNELASAMRQVSHRASRNATSTDDRGRCHGDRPATGRRVPAPRWSPTAWSTSSSGSLGCASRVPSRTRSTTTPRWPSSGPPRAGSSADARAAAPHAPMADAAGRSWPSWRASPRPSG